MRLLARPRLRFDALALVTSVAVLTSGLMVVATSEPVEAGANRSVTVSPNVDGTLGAFTQTGCTGATFYDCINDDPDSPNESDYVEGPAVTDGNMFLQLGDMPADFVAAAAVTINARTQKITEADDNIDLYYRVMQSDETTNLTNETPTSRQTTAWGTHVKGVAITGTNTKAIFDGARLRIRQDHLTTGAIDVTTRARIAAVEVQISYFSTTFGKLTQASYIFEGDDGSNVDGNSQQAASNTPLTNVRMGERLTLRTQITNNGAAITDTELGLFYDRGDNIWSKVRKSGGMDANTGAVACNDSDFECQEVIGTNNISDGYMDMALDPTGNPWIVFRDGSGDLEVARRVGSGGNCGGNAWACEMVKGTTTDSGGHATIAFSPSGQAWVLYRTCS